MNTPILISPLGLAGGTTPVLPGPAPENASGTFADSLSMMLAGAQAQALVPMPNPVVGQPTLGISLTTGSGGNAGINLVGSASGDGNLDLTGPLLDRTIGKSDGLIGPTAQQSGAASEQGSRNASNAALANAGHDLSMPVVKPAEGIDSNINSAEPLGFLKSAGSLATASHQERNGLSVAIAAGSLLAPDDATLPEQVLPQLRQVLASQTNDESSADRNIKVVDQSGQARPIDPSNVAINPTLRPLSERETRSPGLQQISGQPTIVSSEGQRIEAEPLVQARAQGPNAQSAVNPALQTKIMASMFPPNATTNEHLTDSVQSALPDAELIDIFGSEIGRIEPVGATSSKSPAQPIQTPHTQIALQIARAVPQGIDRLSVQLHPAELGGVHIQLDFAEDGHVSALITAERPETLDLLQRDSRALAQSLNDTGLDLENGGLSFSLQQEQHQQSGGFNESSRQRSQAYSNDRDQEGEGNISPGQEPVRISQRLLDIST